MIAKFNFFIYRLKRRGLFSLLRTASLYTINECFSPFYKGKSLARFLLVRMPNALAARMPNWFWPARVLNHFPMGLEVRRFVDPRLGRERFFQLLKERQIRYVLLRWFQELPHWPALEDMDLLIHAEDLSKVKDLFVRFPQEIPVDLYAHTALPGADYKKTAYFSSPLALQVLKDRVFHRDLYSIPSEEHQVLSFIYHLVFHKSKINEARYENELNRLSRIAGFHLPADLNQLYKLLKSKGWLPTLDALRRLANGNDLLISKLPAPDKTRDGELMAFFIRSSSSGQGVEEKLIRWMQEDGLDPFFQIQLNEEQTGSVEKNVRGGEWGKGTFPKSGGRPKTLVLAYDYAPKFVANDPAHPHVRNLRFFRKEIWRDRINSDRFRWEWSNFIHSSDDELEAWDNLRNCFPERVSDIEKEVQKRRECYHTEYRVIRTLESSQTRSKVELIEFQNAPAVKKTFKIGSERFCEREKWVYQELSKESKLIPSLLLHATNYVIIPYYKNILNPENHRRLLRERAPELRSIFQFFFDRGLALINFNPDNLILTAEGDLKIVDFEFLYRYSQKPTDLKQSYDIRGIPKNFEGDIPLGGIPSYCYYDLVWKPLIGRL